jgi:tripartite ATP-independent transporter DctP family solute receptor
MLRKLVIISVLMMAAMGFAFANGGSDAQAPAASAGITQPTTLRLAHVYNPGHAWDEGAKLAAKLIKERTNGLITVEVFPASQLGTEEQITEAVIFGSVDFAVSGAGQIGNLFKPIYVAEMPYLFKDLDHVMRFASSDIAQQMFADLENEFGIKVIGTSAYGIRHLASVNKPIVTPADLAGFKMRVPQQQVTVAYGRAMGAEPTPIAFSEAYMALQQGVVDGLENPLSGISAMKFYEVAKYINLTAHVTNLCFFLMNGDLYGSLSPEQQVIFTDAFAEASVLIIDLLKADDASLGAFFESQGCTIVQSDVAAFRAKTKDMPNQFRSWWIRYGEDLFTRIQNM